MPVCLYILHHSFTIVALQPESCMHHANRVQASFIGIDHSKKLLVAYPWPNAKNCPHLLEPSCCFNQCMVCYFSQMSQKVGLRKIRFATSENKL